MRISSERGINIPNDLCDARQCGVVLAWGHQYPDRRPRIGPTEMLVSQRVADISNAVRRCSDCDLWRAPRLRTADFDARLSSGPPRLRHRCAQAAASSTHGATHCGQTPLRRSRVNVGYEWGNAMYSRDSATPP